ncbi:DUF3027 domain-containing protein [Microlunatus parietis]|uniref:DUF3027 domain-containing protein n=1 Tax=Microlunatus parietis TaxID=682979 RepID=A0A7Y9LD42_9ACTN|nr:DUF3027 domain-containing protein [Microlunatus parietis]NYE73502.1 hypothetical protein [Microlunatus parietis]
MPPTVKRSAVKRTVKADQICVDAVELARDAAVESSGQLGVGDHLGYEAEAERLVSHFFACPHPGYRGWRWSVTVVRASRAKTATVNEVVLLPGDEALLAAGWVPWAERIQPGDVTAGLVLPTPDNDPRLEPGYTGGEQAADTDPAEASQTRAIVAELGLGRERVLTPLGRDEAAERWLAGAGGPDNETTRLAPGPCLSCGFFVRLSGRLGTSFGVCGNAYSASDGQVVAIDHGCGAHSNVASDDRAAELPPPVWDTIAWDEQTSLFD